MIKTIIFDFGGVIINVANIDSTVEIAQAMGIDEISFKKLHGPVIQKMAEGKIGEAEYWSELTKLTGKTKPQYCKELWRNKINNNAKLYPKMAKFVNQLRKGGFKCFILSNTIPPHEEVIAAKGWYDFFDGAYFSNRIGFYKPDIRAYKYVLDKERLVGEDCVFVDDLEVNLVPAKKLGMKTVLAKSSEQVIKDIREIINL